MKTGASTNGELSSAFTPIASLLSSFEGSNPLSETSLYFTNLSNTFDSEGEIQALSALSKKLFKPINTYNYPLFSNRLTCLTLT